MTYLCILRGFDDNYTVFRADDNTLFTCYGNGFKVGCRYRLTNSTMQIIKE